MKFKMIPLFEKDIDMEDWELYLSITFYFEPERFSISAGLNWSEGGFYSPILFFSFIFWSLEFHYDLTSKRYQ